MTDIVAAALAANDLTQKTLTDIGRHLQRAQSLTDRAVEAERRIGALLDGMGVSHRWVGTRLDIMGPDGWVTGPDLKGLAARPHGVEMRATDTHLQWRDAVDGTWADIIDIPAVRAAGDAAVADITQAAASAIEQAVQVAGSVQADRALAAAAAQAASQAAAAASVSADRLVATSTTLVEVTTGEKALSVESGRAFTAGIWVALTAPGAYLSGRVVSYAGTSLVVDVDRADGAGTYTGWTIVPAGATGRGARTLSGDRDPSGQDGAIGDHWVQTAAGLIGKQGDHWERKSAGWTWLFNAIGPKGDTPRDPGAAVVRDLPEEGDTSGSLFQLSVREETALRVSPGNVSAEAPTVLAPVLQQAYIGFPSQYRTAGGLAIPADVSGSHILVPISELMSTPWVSAVAQGILEPVSHRRQCIDTFRFRGRYPLYTVLTGALSYLLRVGDSAAARTAHNLWLRMVSGPSWEVGGQHSGHQRLGGGMASLHPAPDAVDRAEFGDFVTVPIGQGDGVQTIFSVNLRGDAVAGSVQAAGVVSGAVVKGADAGSGAITGAVTGTVIYTGEPSITVTFPAPPDAGTTVYVRYNPLLATSGLWTRRSIHVCAPIVLYPDGVYRITVGVVTVSGSPALDPHGLRIESGGLAFFYDASHPIREAATRLTTLGD